MDTCSQQDRTFADRLNLERRKSFVGRTSERAVFQDMLMADLPPFRILYLYGPDGIGKTSLLTQFVYACGQNQTSYIMLCGRDLDTSSPAALKEQCAELVLSKLPHGASGEQAPRNVLLIDDYEMLLSIDTWIREQFLPQLPDNTLVVIASRLSPSLYWRADLGWQRLVRFMPLRNLLPEESKAYLLMNGIPANKHGMILGYTHGHPLALSLIVNEYVQQPTDRFRAELGPDVTYTLVHELVSSIPSASHRRALEVCAMVQVITETLLASILDEPDAQAYFHWLRGLSCMQSGPRGLHMHDLAREALLADLRWRNPEWYQEILNRAHSHFFSQIEKKYGDEQHQLLLDYLFLYRHENQDGRFWFELDPEQNLPLPVPAHAVDSDKIARFICQREGAETARLFTYWCKQQPHSMFVFLDEHGQISACLGILHFQQVTDENRLVDPGVQRVWQYLQNRERPQAGEQVSFVRFLILDAKEPSLSPVPLLLLVTMIQHFLGTQELAYTFICTSSNRQRFPFFEEEEFAHLHEADFATAEHAYAIYGHDWRVMPPLAWLSQRKRSHDVQVEQPLAPTAPPSPTTELPTPSEVRPLLLSETDFATAIRDAVRDVCFPDALRNNPLLNARMVLERTGARAKRADKIAALQDMMLETLEAMKTSPRRARLYRALYHTYFQPEINQERVAELLDLPFSTFRGHLKAGMKLLTDMLWQREHSVD